MKLSESAKRAIEMVRVVCDQGKWFWEDQSIGHPTLECNRYGQKIVVGDVCFKMYIETIEDFDEDEPLEVVNNRMVAVMSDSRLLLFATAPQVEPEHHLEKYSAPELSSFRLRCYQPGPWLFTLIAAHLRITGKL